MKRRLMTSEMIRTGNIIDLEKLLDTPDVLKVMEEKNSHGYTAVQEAALHGQAEIMLLLMGKGVNQQVQQDGLSLFDLYISSKRANKEKTKLKYSCSLAVKKKKYGTTFTLSPTTEGISRTLNIKQIKINVIDRNEQRKFLIDFIPIYPCCNHMKKLNQRLHSNGAGFSFCYTRYEIENDSEYFDDEAYLYRIDSSSYVGSLDKHFDRFINWLCADEGLNFDPKKTNTINELCNTRKELESLPFFANFTSNKKKES